MGFEYVYLDNISYTSEINFKEFYHSVIPTMSSAVGRKLISINTGDFNNTWYPTYWQNNIVINYTQTNDNDYLNTVNKLKSELTPDKFLNEYGS